ncbi:MAG TPA: hypothetical protein VKU19_21225 [Bryobacteraceae bacterium]|nr:hypothetical protein [Bryobacteraceae bacterium]
MADFLGLEVTADEPIAGLSAALEREPSAAPERRIELLTAAAAAQGVGAPAGRGPEVWRTVMDTLLRRKVMQVLGPFEVPTHWMCFHVPPGGKGQLKVTNTAGSEYGLKLKAVGSGWGSGRNLKLTVNRDFLERTRCLRVSLALQARVTLYEGGVPPRADVLGVAGLSIDELAECPDCSGENERRGAMVVPSGEWIDLRGDPLGYTVETALELADHSDLSLSAPFAVPGLNVQIGIECTRRSQLNCSTRYVLPGGHRYRPSTSYGEPADLPYWRCE